MRPAASTLWINWVILWHDLFSGGVIQHVWVCHCFLVRIRASCVTTSARFQPLSHEDIQARVLQRAFFPSSFSNIHCDNTVRHQGSTLRACVFYCRMLELTNQQSRFGHEIKAADFFIFSMTSLYKLFKWLHAEGFHSVSHGLCRFFLITLIPGKWAPIKCFPSSLRGTCANFFIASFFQEEEWVTVFCFCKLVSLCRTERARVSVSATEAQHQTFHAIKAVV